MKISEAGTSDKSSQDGRTPGATNSIFLYTAHFLNGFFLKQTRSGLRTRLKHDSVSRMRNYQKVPPTFFFRFCFGATGGPICKTLARQYPSIEFTQLI